MGNYTVPTLGSAEMADKITTIKSFWVTFDTEKQWQEMTRFLRRTSIEEFLNSEFYEQMREVFDADAMEYVITQVHQLAVVSGKTWQHILQPGLTGGIYNVVEEEVAERVKRVMVVDPREMESQTEVSWDDDGVRWVARFYVITVEDKDEDRQDLKTDKYLKKTKSTDLLPKSPARKIALKVPTESVAEPPQKPPQTAPFSTKDLKDLFS